jgi:hypothetical protein
MLHDSHLPPLLLLHAEDNVFVARRTIAADETLEIDGKLVRANAVVLLGHKVARYALAPGAPVFKHGAPIGSTTRSVAAGEHLHLHNMKSDYLPSHTRQMVAPRS